MCVATMWLGRPGMASCWEDFCVSVAHLRVLAPEGEFEGIVKAVQACCLRQLRVVVRRGFREFALRVSWFFFVTSQKTEATTPLAPHEHPPRWVSPDGRAVYLPIRGILPRPIRRNPPSKRPSQAFPTTSLPRTSSEMTILTIPQISHGSMW